MFSGVLPKGQPRTARTNAEEHITTNSGPADPTAGYKDSAYLEEPSSDTRPTAPTPYRITKR